MVKQPSWIAGRGARGGRRAPRWGVPLALLCASVAAAQSQPAFDPLGGDDPARYQFDLARNFYPSPEAEEADRRRLASALAALARRAAEGGPWDAAALDRLLADADSLMGSANKHAAYAALRENLGLPTDGNAARVLSDTLGIALRAVGDRLMSVGDPAFRRLAAAHPSLRRWEFLRAEAARRLARDTRRNAEVDRRLAESQVAPALVGWQAPLFARLSSETDFGTVSTPTGPLSVGTQWLTIAQHPDRAVREAGFRLGKAGLARHQETYALVLRSTVQSYNALSRLRGFADYREDSYGERGLSPGDVRATLAQVASIAETNRRYERLRAEHAKVVAGVDTAHTWDLLIPEPGMPVPRFTFAEAREVARRALAPLGPTYAAELDALLDPANGRLDLVPRPGRAQRPGFSTGLVGYPSMFFQGRYDGYVDDVVILVHEGGHAVQNMLMTRNRVPAFYAWGPSYFTESFAGFNELLLLDYLYRTATDRAHRTYYLQRFLDQATGIFKTAREADVEDALYDSIPAGRLTSAREIEALMQAVGSRYSTWFHPGGEQTMEWVNSRQYFTWPLYRVNYLYSMLLALAYFDAYTRDPERFVPRYLSLLGRGYGAPPSALLREYVGMDLRDPALVQGARRVIEGRMAELEALYGAAGR
ncbi:MAG TPA: M3 family metallopeptidase [Longimicrobium sp.]|jgi:oligoendopeptidase F